MGEDKTFHFHKVWWFIRFECAAYVFVQTCIRFTVRVCLN